VFFSAGFYKGATVSGSSSVDPLPFLNMPSYPYSPALYPPTLDAYVAEWNTRVNTKRSFAKRTQFSATGVLSISAGTE
jgi:hypothetical protein